MADCPDVIAANDANAALDPSNEQTFDVLAKLMSELAGIFPDTYFHLGGECSVREVPYKSLPCGSETRSDSMRSLIYFCKQVTRLATGAGRRASVSQTSWLRWASP